MKVPRIWLVLLLCAIIGGRAWASAYNAQPKLVVVIIVDQLRPDLLERASDQFGASGIRLLTERGAFFPDCYYDYANTETAPGHATLFTGAYSDGHGIAANQWWDGKLKRMVSSVFDTTARQVGVDGPGISPHNLLSDTIGDELKLATDGQSRVYAISLKDRAAVLSAGFTADGAFWIDHKTGAWVSSTFYMPQIPAWAQQFNASGKADKYWDREWKDATGKVLRRTSRGDFYDSVGSTPFANDYELEFARELMAQEKLGEGKATDLLIISLSAPDIIGHKVGPNSSESRAMVLALDRQLSDFFNFLGQRLGLASVWIALSADHGVAPAPAYAQRFRLPAQAFNPSKLKADLNAAIAARLKKPGNYIEGQDGSFIFLSEAAFAAAGISNEAEGERIAGEALLPLGFRSYFGRAQLAAGDMHNDASGREMLHSYSAYGGWYVITVTPPFGMIWDSPAGTMHGSWYSYDRHVPLAFFGLPFQPGRYHSKCEPVDMVATLSSLLGIDPPSRAAGHVLQDAVRWRGSAR